MNHAPEPVIGQWYSDHGEQRLFEVIGLDEGELHIQVQCEDGEVLSLSHDDWCDRLLSNAAPPRPESAGDDSDSEPGWDGDDWHGHLDDLADLDD